MEGRTRIHIFGNRELGFDSLPLRIAPLLRMQFPDIEFIELDPNENWDIPDPFLIIDTVQGIPDIRIFRGLKEFDAAPAVSVHDFDALFNLRYLEKLGKLKRVVIVGVPPGVNENAALTDVSEALRRVIETND